MGRDRRTDHGESGASRAGVGIVDAGRIQERHGWQYADGGGCDPVGAFAHWFPSVTKEGVSAIFQTSGNDSCHVILRGGTRSGPNFDAAHVARVCGELAARGLRETVMIDCSHGNSH